MTNVLNSPPFPRTDSVAAAPKEYRGFDNITCLNFEQYNTALFCVTLLEYENNTAGEVSSHECDSKNNYP